MIEEANRLCADEDEGLKEGIGCCMPMAMEASKEGSSLTVELTNDGRVRIANGFGTKKKQRGLL